MFGFRHARRGGPRRRRNARFPRQRGPAPEPQSEEVDLASVEEESETPLLDSLETGESTGSTEVGAEDAQLFSAEPASSESEESSGYTVGDSSPESTAEVYADHAEAIPNMEVDTSDMGYEIDVFQSIWEANQDRYEAVAEQAGIPAVLIAAIHFRESSGNFDTYLHNGEALGQVTTLVPEGILFYDWEEAAVHALAMKDYVSEDLGMTEDTTDLAAMATFAEYYNGLGYHNMGEESAYVYSGTDVYDGGRYVADGEYDPNSFDSRPGILALIDSISGGLEAEGGGSTVATPDTEAPELITYTVVSGDTLSAIAGQYGTTVDALVERNSISNPDLIYVGQVLEISGQATEVSEPASDSVSETSYTVVSGDTLGEIAARFGTTVEDLVERNNIADANLIFVGQVLSIVGDGSSSSTGTTVDTAASSTGSSEQSAPPAEGLAGERGAYAVTAAALSFEEGQDLYGSGSWEVDGENYGPLVDEIQAANGSSGGYDWCGMFVGAQYAKVGIREEILNNYVFWSGYRLREFFLHGKYVATSTPEAGDWWSNHHTVELGGLTGESRKDTLDSYDPAPGDVAVFYSGSDHVGMVADYDRSTGDLEIFEGNSGDRVKASIYDTGDGDITFLARFNDEDYEPGGSVDAALQDAEMPNVLHSSGGGSVS